MVDAGRSVGWLGVWCPRLCVVAGGRAGRRRGASGVIETQCATVRTGRSFPGVLGNECSEWSKPRFPGVPWGFPKSSAKPAACRPFSAPGSKQLHREVIRQLFARARDWQIECLWLPTFRPLIGGVSESPHRVPQASRPGPDCFNSFGPCKFDSGKWEILVDQQSHEATSSPHSAR